MKELDISYTSVRMLELAASRFLGANIFIPDWSVYLKDKENITCENVLVAGLFYQKVFEVNDWPRNDFHLFCLCGKVKRVLVEMLNFDSEVVSVLPRYGLFPCADIQLPFPASKNFTLVHAGRISAQKNIEFMIFVNFYFQLLASREINLLLLGKYDNDHPRNVLGLRDVDYKDKITKLLNSLPWPGKKPVIVTDLNEDAWLQNFPSNGICFSTSNLISEDFSVSVAQVQKTLGAPCLLPLWGGLADVRGENINFYDSKYIATSNESFSMISSKAKLFVESYLRNNLFLEKKSFEHNEFIPNPKKINQDYLQLRKNENISKWGPEIEYVQHGQFHLFAKSENGQLFFKELMGKFSQNI
jgi:hypothetical protein